MTYRGDDEQLREMERRHEEEVEAQARSERRARREAASSRAAQRAREEEERAKAKLERAQEQWRNWKPKRRKARRPPTASVAKDDPWHTRRDRGPESWWSRWPALPVVLLLLAFLAGWFCARLTDTSCP